MLLHSAIWQAVLAAHRVAPPCRNATLSGGGACRRQDSGTVTALGGGSACWVVSRQPKWRAGWGLTNGLLHANREQHNVAVRAGRPRQAVVVADVDKPPALAAGRSACRGPGPRRTAGVHVRRRTRSCRRRATCTGSLQPGPCSAGCHGALPLERSATQVRHTPRVMASIRRVMLVFSALMKKSARSGRRQRRLGRGLRSTEEHIVEEHSAVWCGTSPPLMVQQLRLVHVSHAGVASLPGQAGPRQQLWQLVWQLVRRLCAARQALRAGRACRSPPARPACACSSPRCSSLRLSSG